MQWMHLKNTKLLTLTQVNSTRDMYCHLILTKQQQKQQLH